MAHQEKMPLNWRHMNIACLESTFQPGLGHINLSTKEFLEVSPELVNDITTVIVASQMFAKCPLALAL